ncbi:MAG TPA: amino acid permease [Acidobacteriota bacterium]
MTAPRLQQTLERDRSELGRFGYAQELLRSMGGFSNFAVSFSIISILTGAVTLYGYGLEMGGPAEMTFGWPLVLFFTLIVAACMGELASAFPTAGGMYHWAAALGGPAWGWFTACFNIIGLIAAVAGIDYGCAQFLAPFLGLESSPRNLLVVYFLVLLSHGLINHYSIRLVALLNDLSVTVHILGVILIVGALFFFAPKQPASFLLRTINSNGRPYFWGFALGLLQAQWTFTGYDASAHLAEETADPRRRVPWAIILSVAVSGVVGYLLLLGLTLAIGDLPATLTAKDAQGNNLPAVIAILDAALGGRAGMLVSAFTAVAMWFCGLSTITSNSRAVYALARDQGMPWSSLYKSISLRHQTPVAAIWLSVGLAFVALIYSGAYSVVTSLSVVGLYTAYILPIFLGWRADRKGRKWQRGPWHLGRFSQPLYLIAAAWTLFICVTMMMPPNELSAKTMLAATLALMVLYLGFTRKRFQAPVWALRGENAPSNLESPRQEVSMPSGLSVDMPHRDVATKPKIPSEP